MEFIKIIFHKFIFKVLLFSIIFCQDFIPVNNNTLNYNQIFFKWPQINNANYYKLFISEVETSYLSNINSIIVSDLVWGNQYSWEVCGYNNSDYLIDCYDSLNFSINSLPDNYPNNVNILNSDQSQYLAGINLIDYESLNFSVALDFNGLPVWFSDKNNFNNSIWSTQFLSNGNIMGFGSNSKGYEFDINSTIVFETSSDYDLHHQFYKTNNNTYFLIDAEIEYHPCPLECPDELPNIIPWQGDRFIELDSNGNLLLEWNSFDYFSLSEYNPIWVDSYVNQWNFGGSPEFDWTHSNSVFFDESANIVYISVRNLSRITAIDYNTKEIIWNLGNSNFMDSSYFDNDFGFSHQHSAQIIDEGNLIFFDNGRDNQPELSRCLEIDFFDGTQHPEIVWEYVLPDSMLTLSRGECDRLLNGNTLITAGRTGNIVELNSNDEIIWHLSVKSNNSPISIYRSDRVPNLYPNTFSFKINNLFGSYSEGYHISYDEDEINFTIYNQGWDDQTFVYQTLDIDENLLNSYQIDISANHNETINLSDFDPLIENYIFKIFPINNSSNYQIIEFDNKFILGDTNNDEEINIQDIIVLINLILNDGYYIYSGDLNSDGGINISDIINLIMIIIGF